MNTYWPKETDKELKGIQGMNELLDVIDLHKSFHPLYKDTSIKHIYGEIYPCLLVGQYILERNEDQEIVGFTNWALFNEEAEDHFRQSIKVRTQDWQCGNRIWIINAINKNQSCLAQIRRLHKFFRNLCEGAMIYYLRIKSEKVLERQVKIKKF